MLCWCGPGVVSSPLPAQATRLLLVIEQTEPGLGIRGRAVDAPAAGGPTPELALVEQPLPWTLFPQR